MIFKIINLLYLNILISLIQGGLIFLKIKKETLESFIVISLIMIIGISWGNRFKHNLYINVNENKQIEQTTEDTQKPK
jgi:hypothetical protein